MRAPLIAVCAVAVLAGCADSRRKTDAKSDEPTHGRGGTPSAAVQMIEDVSRKTAVKAGRRAQATIEKTSAERNRDLDEVLE